MLVLRPIFALNNTTSAVAVCSSTALHSSAKNTFVSCSIYWALLYVVQFFVSAKTEIVTSNENEGESSALMSI